MNNKLNEKIKFILKFHKSIEIATNKIAKLRKFSEKDRVEAIINLYTQYFVGKKDVFDTKQKMFELYYENFMFNDIKNEAQYNKFYNLCYDEIIYFHFINIKNLFEKLNANNLNNSLNNNDKKFVDSVYKIIEKYNMDENFNYEEFYTNNQLQLDISNDIRWLINDINKDYSFNHYELEQ